MKGVGAMQEHLKIAYSRKALETFGAVETVSYTHLDVYKRQPYSFGDTYSPYTPYESYRCAGYGGDDTAAGEPP